MILRLPLYLFFEGSGSLRAKFELSDGPSVPATLAVQFFTEGSTLSGVEMELVGSGYRLSLNKKRLVSGKLYTHQTKSSFELSLIVALLDPPWCAHINTTLPYCVETV